MLTRARKLAGSNTQAVYELVRGDLLSCRIPPGKKIKINELCERVGASLGAIREALSRLTAEGLVTANPQRGFSATPLSAQDLVDLTMVRSDIEAQCLARAIAMGGADWEAGLRKAHERLMAVPMRHRRDPARVSDAWALRHLDYHEALVAACDSPWLLRIRATLYAQSERYRRLSIPLGKAERDIEGEHAAIAEAALARDEEAAVRLLREHLRRTTRVLSEALSAMES